MIVRVCNRDRPPQLSGRSFLTEPGQKAAEAPNGPSGQKAGGELIEIGRRVEFCFVSASEESQEGTGQAPVAHHATAPEL